MFVLCSWYANDMQMRTEQIRGVSASKVTSYLQFYTVGEKGTSSDDSWDILGMNSV
jgi:hypothetical protein